LFEILHSKNHKVFQNDILKTDFYEKLFEIAFYFSEFLKLSYQKNNNKMMKYLKRHFRIS